MTLFERTKKASNERGLSLQQVAEKAGLSKNTIYKWKDNQQNPRFVTVKAVAEVLNVSVDYLLGNTDNKHSNISFSQLSRKSSVNELANTAEKLSDDDIDNLLTFAKALKDKKHE